MLRNFDREDLDVLWKLVKERFASTKPNNFSDDFLLTTLGAMFEKPDVQAQFWRNQRSVYGLAKVKSWKLLESYDLGLECMMMDGVAISYVSLITTLFLLLATLRAVVSVGAEAAVTTVMVAAAVTTSVISLAVVTTSTTSLSSDGLIHHLACSRG
nr:hypothetical protein [Tanacetum cinerariifolium]